MKTDYQTGIIGSGLGGITMALNLKKAGDHSFILLERAANAGGIWRDNIYPGCACDVAAPLYSFAEEPNPNWDNLFATQPEIFAYINQVIDRNGLRAKIRFDTDITDAVFIPEYGHWRLSSANNETITVKVLVLALGRLNQPSIPHFKDLDQYTGKIIHSSSWDKSYPFNHKNVAVIGTGASAVQIIPSIAGQLSQLTVFQRSAPWVANRNNVYFPAKIQQKLKKYPLLMQLMRRFYFLQSEFLGALFFGPRWLNKFAQKILLRKLKKSVVNPVTRQKLIPNYELGCKRVMRSDDYYPVFNQPNVCLETDQIESFTTSGIKTITGKEYQFDVVVMATGFEAAKMSFDINVIGLKGSNLWEVWQQTDAACYKGMVTSGFPNLACIVGPNTGSAFGSSLLIMEYQSDYINEYINQISYEGENSYMDLKKEVQELYVTEMRKRFTGTIWGAADCTSWQYNSNGKNVVAYPGLSSHFRKITKKFDKEEYITFTKEMQQIDI